MAKKKPRRTTLKKKDRPKITKTVPYVGPQDDDRMKGVDPGLAAAVKSYKPPIVASKPVRPAGMPSFLAHTPSAGFGGAPPSIQTTGGGISILGERGALPPDDKTPIIKGDIPPDDDEKEKKEDEAKKKAEKTAKWLTNWWSDRSGKSDYKGYRKYGDRKSLLSGDIRNTQAKVTEKIQDKLNKGYYKIVDGPDGEPLIIHASTGTPVNPFTGHIVDTQSQGAQGGGYQNDMARALGIDKKHAGVFSTEYQRGNGLSVSEMKPQHALRFLMKKNSKAFEEFFQMNKAKKGFNPFSVGTISSAMGAILNKITGPEALQVGNNLERAGWGKAIENKDGSYSIKLTEKGANAWSDSFNFDKVSFGGNDYEGFTSPAAIAKDQNKGWLSEILGTKKFPDQPIDLTNLIDQGGYFEGMVPGASGSGGLTTGEMLAINKDPWTDSDMTRFDPKNPKQWLDATSLQTKDPYLNPEIPFQDVRGWMPPTDLRPAGGVTGTPSSWIDPKGGSLTNYPQFTPEGYNIGAYNPSRDYSGGTGQTRTGDGGGGGGTTPDPNDPNNPYGNLTFDVHGRPITYDYTGGPEQIQLAGGWKRDGQYIGSPWGFKDGGIANFRPYGY